ncbi:MAG TPA: hypothetical protein VGS20_05950 [Candidatus Acidoferrales bacterium]|nr:hypothetical protein [Candidatus Acidoferrales bacterium]
MFTIEAAETCKPPASSREVARRWMVRFGELFGRELTVAMVALWTDAVSDLRPDVLESACRQAARTARFFPTPGEVRAAIDQANAAGLELEAEAAWQQALGHARDWCGDRRAPRLPPKIEQAVRAAGGLHWIESCPEKELVWAQRKFLEAFKRADELDRAGHLLTRGEAGRILAEASAAANVRALPGTQAAARDGSADDNIGLAGARDILAQFAAPPPTPQRQPKPATGPVVVHRDDREVARQKVALAEWLSRRRARGEAPA